MNYLFFDHLTPGASPLHHIDPRVKIIAVVVLSMLIFRAGPGEIAMISMFIAMAIYLARLELRDIWRFIKPVVFFVALLFLLHLFSTPGREIIPLSVLPVHMTYEGMERGALVCWEFLALITAGALLTMTTCPSALVAALEKLLRPLKALGVPTQDLAVMVSMALRFFPTFIEEYHRMKTARIARGGDFQGERLSRKVKTVVALAVPLIISAFRRADDLAAAMEARGYTRGTRTTLRELRLTRVDVTTVIIFASFTGLTIAVRLLT